MSIKRFVLGMSAEASVSDFMLLLLIKLIFAAVLPQSWMLNKTISLFDCVSAESLKGV